MLHSLASCAVVEAAFRVTRRRFLRNLRTAVPRGQHRLAAHRSSDLAKATSCEFLPLEVKVANSCFPHAGILFAAVPVQTSSADIRRSSSFRPKPFQHRHRSSNRHLPKAAACRRSCRVEQNWRGWSMATLAMKRLFRICLTPPQDHYWKTRSDQTPRSGASLSGVSSRSEIACRSIMRCTLGRSLPRCSFNSRS